MDLFQIQIHNVGYGHISTLHQHQRPRFHVNIADMPLEGGAGPSMLADIRHKPRSRHHRTRRQPILNHPHDLIQVLHLHRIRLDKLIRLPSGLVNHILIPGQGGKRCELGSTVFQRHPRMPQRGVMLHVNYVVVSSHRSCFMAAYLAVPVLLCGPFLEVQTSEDGVLAEFLL